MTSLSSKKGDDFEIEVGKVLFKLEEKHPKHVKVIGQPRVELQTGEIVKPDFDLSYSLPHAREFYFIECQDRIQSSKSILHKIQYIRNLHKRNNFIFLYRKSISKNTKLSLEKQGVQTFTFEEFRVFVGNIDKTLEKTKSEKNKVEKRNYGQGDSAMLASAAPPKTFLTKTFLNSNENTELLDFFLHNTPKNNIDDHNEDLKKNYSKQNPRHKISFLKRLLKKLY